ncbi:MAG: DUF2917 domain-containing protein [Rubrivivax sp.]|nr:DUF2917 domain-containing protein [Rubrivivax sp.]
MLLKGQTLVVRHPLGMALECVRGTLWITHDGDRKDIVLQQGESYVAARTSTMLIHALDDSTVRI